MEDRMLRAQSAEVYSAVMDNDGGAGAYPVVADRGYDQRFSSRPRFRPSGPFRQDFRSRPPPSPMHRSYVPRSSPQMSATPPMPRIDPVTPSRSRTQIIQHDLRPVGERAMDTYSVRPPKGIVSERYPRFTRRVFSNPDRDAFGSWAWDYDNVKNWPGTISPSGHFVVVPDQCIYCLRMGHLSRACPVPTTPKAREEARVAAFRQMGITIRTNVAPFYFSTPNQRLVAGVASDTMASAFLTSTRLPPSSRDPINPGPDGSYDGDMDGHPIFEGDNAYWPSYVQAAYEQRRWDVPIPSIERSHIHHPLYIPGYTFDEPVPDSTPHFLSRAVYAQDGEASLEETLATCTDEQYIAFEFLQDQQTEPTRTPSPTTSRHSAFFVSPSVCSASSMSSAFSVDSSYKLRSMPTNFHSTSLYRQTFDSYKLPTFLLSSLDSPACVVDKRLPVDVAANVAAASSPSSFSFGNDSNPRSTPPAPPFTDYDAKIPDGAHRFFNRDVPGVDTISISTFVDSAATVPMSGSPDLFQDLRLIHPPVFVGGAFGSGGFATHAGRVCPLLEDVSGRQVYQADFGTGLYVPGLGVTLISQLDLMKRGIRFTNTRDRLLFRRENGVHFGMASFGERQIELEASAPSLPAKEYTAHASALVATTAKTWHARFGHIGSKRWHELCTGKWVTGFDCNSTKLGPCISCAAGKSKACPNRVITASNSCGDAYW
ncbi:hypothetical protein BT69DRAFT_1334590 [Atractiella rhizophila]|nr:hypothetical protein BT69DRAFT_1334590 [Atractiella rhizophila]